MNKEITHSDIEEMKGAMKYGGITCVILLSLLIFGYLLLGMFQTNDARVINALNEIRSTYDSLLPFAFAAIVLFLVYIVVPYFYYRNKVEVDQ